MKNFNDISLGSLLFIGPAIGTLLFYLFMDWRYKSTTNEVTDEQIVQYMENSQAYPMIFSDFTYKKDRYDKSYYKKHKSRTQCIFYNSYLNKYFTYVTIDIYNVLEKDFASIKEIPFMGKVNIDEMNSGKGNSIDDPILVWKIELDSTTISIKDPWQEEMYKRGLRKDEQYRGTLYYYFKLFVSKEEFEKTFPKKE